MNSPSSPLPSNSAIPSIPPTPEVPPLQRAGSDERDDSDAAVIHVARQTLSQVSPSVPEPVTMHLGGPFSGLSRGIARARAVFSRPEGSALPKRLPERASAKDIKKYLEKWKEGSHSEDDTINRESVQDQVVYILDNLSRGGGYTKLCVTWDALPDIFHTNLIKDHLEYLHISGSSQGPENLLESPELKGNLIKLRGLSLSGNNEHIEPQQLASIGDLSNLRNLTITDYRGLNGLPETIGQLSNLVKLEIENTGITSLTDSVCNLPLTQLILKRNDQLTDLSSRCKEFILNGKGGLPSMDVTLKECREELIRSLNPGLNPPSVDASLDEIREYLKLWAREVGSWAYGESVYNKQNQTILCDQIMSFLENESSGKLILPWDVLPNIFHTKLMVNKIKDLEIEHRVNGVSNEQMLKTLNFGGLVNLSRLSFKNCLRVNVLDQSVFSNLKALRELDLSGTALTKLPGSLFQLRSLNTLELNGCVKLQQLPNSYNAKFSDLKALTRLSLKGCSELKFLPPSLGSMQHLRYLDISDCSNLTELPEGMGPLLELHMREAGVSSLPISLYRAAFEERARIDPPNEIVEWMNHQMRNAYKIENNELKIRIKPETAIPFATEHLRSLVFQLEQSRQYNLPINRSFVQYEGQLGIDAGGLSRDFWYQRIPYLALQMQATERPLLIDSGKGYFILECPKTEIRLGAMDEKQIYKNIGKLCGAVFNGVAGEQAKLGTIFPRYFYIALCKISLDYKGAGITELIRTCAKYDTEGIKDEEGRLIFDIDYSKRPSEMSDEDLYKVWKMTQWNGDGEFIKQYFPSLEEFILPEDSLEELILPEDNEKDRPRPGFVELEKRAGFLAKFRSTFNEGRNEAELEREINKYITEAYQRQVFALLDFAEGFRTMVGSEKEFRDKLQNTPTIRALIGEGKELSLLEMGVALSNTIQGLPITKEAIAAMMTRSQSSRQVQQKMELIKRWYTREVPEGQEEELLLQQKDFLRCITGRAVITGETALRFHGPQPASDREDSELSRFSIFHTCSNSVNLGTELMNQEIETEGGKAAFIRIWLEHITQALPPEDSVGGFELA